MLKSNKAGEADDLLMFIVIIAIIVIMFIILYLIISKGIFNVLLQ